MRLFINMISNLTDDKAVVCEILEESAKAFKEKGKIDRDNIDRNIVKWDTSLLIVDNGQEYAIKIQSMPENGEREFKSSNGEYNWINFGRTELVSRMQKTKDAVQLVNYINKIDNDLVYVSQP